MAGKYKAYPEYKDSGVEWIGQIPSDWDMWKLLHACDYIASGTTPKSDDETKYYGGEILWVTTGELRENIISDTQKKITGRALLDMPTLRVHPEGSVSIAMYGATIGRLGIFGKRATTNQACCVMPPSKILFNKYLFYWLFATRQEIINLSSGGGQPNVNQEKIASLKVSAPSYDLQQIIANFLDHETAKIDTLIEKQQQLIQLLKEKRQAVISHAVTKGLNPDVPMKDSGVEWLGEVPEHWEVKKLKHVISSLESGVSVNAADVPAQSFEYGVLKTSCVYTRSFRSEENKTVLLEEVERLKCPVRKGAIVISRMNTPDLVGASALVLEDAHNLFLPDRLWQTVFKNPSEQNSKYIAYFMMTEGFRKQISLSAEGASTSMQNIAKEDYLSINILLPDALEQESIVNSIDQKVTKIDSLIEKQSRQIELMQERRTALISAAVTGKIDVRLHASRPTGSA